MTNKIKRKSFNVFKRYFMFLIFYSVGGFILERIVNVVFLGEWYDNSVLIGPYQPLYGSGVLLTIIFFDTIYKRFRGLKDIYKEIILIIVAILFTGFVEAVTGFGFEILFNKHLWDYGDTFPCKLDYICFIPTTLFGIISYLVVKYLHPQIKFHIERTSDVLFYIILLIFLTDILYTFINL